MESFLNPNEVLNKLELSKDMVAADFGCGSGGWTIPLAKKLENGIVYALDILEEQLSALKGKMVLEKVDNIRLIRSDIENKNGSTLTDKSVDLVLIINLLFQCEEKKAVFEEAERILKSEGKILVVDWLKDNPLTKKIEYVNFDEIKEIAKGLGLKLEKEFKAGIYHWGLIFKKR